MLSKIFLFIFCFKPYFTAEKSINISSFVEELHYMYGIKNFDWKSFYRISLGLQKDIGFIIQRNIYS